MVNERFSRQSFIGENFQEQIATCVVGIIGLGGGGSHIVQQLAHIGFKRYVLYDDDKVEESNLNRLVGGTSVDAKAESTKLFVAQRTILALQPNAEVQAISAKWQSSSEALRQCHIIFGCIDSYQGRQELEIITRQYLIPYIDIGMDVHGKNPPRISGQVILSMPGTLCLKCLGFLTDDSLRHEANRYGVQENNPQVIWANGVLASTAVGIAVDLIANWTKHRLPYEYLVYDGNNGTVKPSVTLKDRIDFSCPHFSLDEVGPAHMMSL